MIATKQEILDRYAKRETVSDTLGRIISVVNLKFSEKLAIRRLAETDDSVVLGQLGLAASVREIDGAIFLFPKTMAELNSTVDILDDEGMVAALAAWEKLRGPIGDNAEKKA